MPHPTHVIGNKNYSSWSLRPWLLLKHIGAEFAEIKINLYTGNYRDRILHYSPAGHVPILIDGSRTIWESLAICEYAAEKWPSPKTWPADAGVRAHARSIAAEMHAGFSALRSEFPMNCRQRRTGVIPSAQAQADIERIVQIWQTCLRSHRGPWLFGEFSIADAMYAPVALRFFTYGVALAPQAAAYVDAVVEDPPIRAWIADARNETEVIAQAERGAPAL
jgi:glutathione S-transferase